MATQVRVDAGELYDEFYDKPPAAEADTLGWLAAVGYTYEALRQENAPKVQRMAWLSADRREPALSASS